MVGACLVGPPSVGSEHDPQPIVIRVFESVGQSTDFFDDEVDGFGAAQCQCGGAAVAVVGSEAARCLALSVPVACSGLTFNGFVDIRLRRTGRRDLIGAWLRPH